MSSLRNNTSKEAPLLVLGNEAMARGAMEAGVKVAAGYPGTPSSEIIEILARSAGAQGIYVEWSSNEKVAVEVAAAASFAGLRSICTMKQNGVNVASDFLLHLALSGTRGGMVLVAAEDPGALSGPNEGDARSFARLLEIPLLEPGTITEAKDMTKWAFDLSEELQSLVMVRSVTRLSHASGNIRPGELPVSNRRAFFNCHGPIFDPLAGPVISVPAALKHNLQQQKLPKAVAAFEASPFNSYSGPENPELLIITSSACHLYSKEAIHLLGVQDRVGLLKLGTTWPLPPRLIERYLRRTHKALIVEEVIPFLEENLKVLAFELAPKIGIKTFYAKRDGTIPMSNELNPDIVAEALCQVLGIKYESVDDAYGRKAQELALTGAPPRELTFCAGCPHRASYWCIHHALAMDGRKGFVCGDIGCYTLGFFPCGFSTVKTIHAMGSGTGLASGFGKLDRFHMDQPALSVCGDSTFYHAVLPALINAVHHRSDIILAVLDNGGTAMTGFQPHPGLPLDLAGNNVPAVDIPAVCRAIGARVEVCDPFELEKTQQTLLDLIKDRNGVRVVVLKQICALSPEKKGRKKYEMRINESLCLGQGCGCNRLCTRIFRCPGLIWDVEKGRARIDEVICAGCGVCASLCPATAIERKEAA